MGPNQMGPNGPQGGHHMVPGGPGQNPPGQMGPGGPPG